MGRKYRFASYAFLLIFIIDIILSITFLSQTYEKEQETDSLSNLLSDFPNYFRSLQALIVFDAFLLFHGLLGVVINSFNTPSKLEEIWVIILIFLLFCRHIIMIIFLANPNEQKVNIMRTNYNNYILENFSGINESAKEGLRIWRRAYYHEIVACSLITISGILSIFGIKTSFYDMTPFDN